MELSYQSLNTANQAREAEELRTKTRKRSLLILIYHHLLEQGYLEAAAALDQESQAGLRRFQVCDNVDLETVLLDYESYYHLKFHKYPRLIRTCTETIGTRPVKSCGKKRTPCSTVKPLPKISSTQTPSPGGTNAPVKDDSTSSSENGIPGPSEYGLSVSSIHIPSEGRLNGKASRNEAPAGKERPIQGAVRGPGSDADHTERLLKPISSIINSEMRDLAAIISKDIYLHSPDVRWDDIIGLEDAKRLVKEAVVYPIKYPQLFTGILSPWKGLLLYGPPGTGKTLLAKAVATECSTTFFNISASSIISKWRGDSEKLVRVLFELARYHAPSTIFLDELESVMGQRGSGPGGEHEGSRRMKTELLIQMDGLARSDHLVFVLAASNLPWELDHAMLRRLEKRILVGLPSEPARQAMISHWLPPVSCSRGVELRTQLDYKMLAEETEGYSGCDIRLVCKEAAMRPVRKIFHALETHQEGDFRNRELPVIHLETVATEDFLEAITHTKPSARTLTHRYTDWEREYQSV